LKTSAFLEKQILITVKSYPVPSFSYGETVCCAGIDLDKKKWIRLYPIPFRDLDTDKRFKKYNAINAKYAKASDDHRPESYRIQSASIEIVGQIGTENKWSRRRELILGAQLKTKNGIFVQLSGENVVLRERAKQVNAEAKSPY
jgi:hypothetical protein